MPNVLYVICVFYLFVDETWELWEQDEGGSTALAEPQPELAFFIYWFPVSHLFRLKKNVKRPTSRYGRQLQAMSLATNLATWLFLQLSISTRRVSVIERTRCQ